MMQKSCETLYWRKFKDCFKDNPKTGGVDIDPATPKRAVASFKRWVKEQNKTNEM